MKTPIATLVAAAALLFAGSASANEWKLDSLREQVSTIPEAQGMNQTDQRQFLCMALTVYHEARGTSRTGQRAVAHVVMNRTESAKFPSSVCGVVWQSYKGRPQFSWTTRAVGGIVPRERAAWAESQRVAMSVIEGSNSDPTGGATHFYNRHVVTPSWARRALHTWIEGAHAFVRLR